MKPQRTTTPCRPDGCEHSDLAHKAFDRGQREGEAGVHMWDNPYKRIALAEAWKTGQSVGELDREAEEEKGSARTEPPGKPTTVTTSE